MNSPNADRQIGEYRLKKLLTEGPRTRTWLAEQISVSRSVLVDELREDQFHYQQEFLADIRAKAAVEHPLIGSVYEALAEPGICFFAHELLPGTTLLQRLEMAEKMEPASLVQVLRKTAESQLHLEALGQATSPLSLAHIHLDNHGVIRIDNLAISGSRQPEQATRDGVALGKSMVALVANARPGSTRMLTLLSWMRGEQVEAPISWLQVRDLTIQIEQQLTEPPMPDSVGSSTPPRLKKKPAMAAIMIASIIVLISALVLSLWMTRKPPPPRQNPLLESTLILIPAGKYPTPDGTEKDFLAFKIAAQEVTIGQYAIFLETLETLAKNQQQRTFDHENQPAEKISHHPLDWPTLFAAAKSASIWNHQLVTLDSPVIGVDWWDCAAYAEWKNARLPTQEEWFAALRKDVVIPSSLKPSAWLPITAKTPDSTPQGLIGMAGSVSEWTSEPATNPANPLGSKKWVIIGGSYLKPTSNALSREWTDDRSLRRPDLGFRLIFDPG